MRKLILFIAALVVSITMSAQTATQDQVNIFDNTYLGVTAGATTPLSFNSVFPVNPFAGLKIGKEVTRDLGFEAEGLVIFNDNGLHQPIDTRVKATNVTVSTLLNMSNILWGYSGKPRVFEIKTNTGLGWMHAWDTPNNFMTAKTGLDFYLNIGKQRAHSFVISPSVYWTIYSGQGIQFNKNRAQLGLALSYVYHFKTSNGTHYFKTYDVGAMIDEINRLNEELEKKPTEVIVEKPVQVVIKEVVKEDNGDKYVFFKFDSDELDDNAKQMLDKLDKAKTYDVLGYASEEGSKEYNVSLSLRRAQAVQKYLNDNNVATDVVKGYGPALGPVTGRVAVVRVK